MEAELTREVSPGLWVVVKGDESKDVSSRNIPREILNIDSGSFSDIYVHDYAYEIFELEKIREKKYMPIDWTGKYTELNNSMRQVLVDWMVIVAEEYRLAADTLYLSVNILDRYLSVTGTTKANLQLIGCTCMILASKYEEVYPPRMREWIEVCNDTYAQGQFREAEIQIATILKCNFNVPTIKLFIRRFLRVIGQETGEISNFTSFVAELTLLDIEFCKYLPSMIAASAIYYSLIVHEKSWDHAIACYSGYNESNIDFLQCVRDVHACHRKNRPKQQNIHEKYDHNMYSYASKKLPIEKLPF